MIKVYDYDGTAEHDLLEQGDVVNDLTTGGTNKALSAEQGKVLKGLVDASQPEGFDQLVSDVAQAKTDIEGLQTSDTQQDEDIAELLAKLKTGVFFSKS